MRRPLILLVFSILFTSIAVGSSTFGDSSTETLPNVSNMEIYNVTGLSDVNKRDGGDLVAKGLNSTLSIGYGDYKIYRFEFTIYNNGSENWSLKENDKLRYEGLDSSWNVKEIFYEISEKKFTGTFTSNKISWNTTKGGQLDTMGPNDTLTAAYIVNISSDTSYDNQMRFLVNDTSYSSGSYDYHKLKVLKYGNLNVTLENPPNNTVLQVNDTFNVTGKVECYSGVCGEIKISSRYNSSGNSAETLVPETSSEPFTSVNSNTLVCDTYLERNEICRKNITLNATGSPDTTHLLDVNASSNISKVENNDSKDYQNTIKAIIIMGLSWETLNFGAVEPGTSNVSAKGNSNLSYNITVSEDSIEVDNLYVKSTDLNSTENTDYWIEPSNMTLNFQNKRVGGYSLMNSFQKIKDSIMPGTVLNSFYFLDVPEGLIDGLYNGEITFKANSTV